RTEPAEERGEDDVDQPLVIRPGPAGSDVGVKIRLHELPRGQNPLAEHDVPPEIRVGSGLGESIEYEAPHEQAQRGDRTALDVLVARGHSLHYCIDPVDHPRAKANGGFFDRGSGAVSGCGQRPARTFQTADPGGVPSGGLEPEDHSGEPEAPEQISAGGVARSKTIRVPRERSCIWSPP